MSNYFRPRVPGTALFFTVALADRQSDLLVRHIALLRQAVRLTLAERPFHINAWVVLPDHLHAIWTLPEGDTDYSTRWSAIKARFSTTVRLTGWKPDRDPSPSKRSKGEVGIWQRRFWEHYIRDDADFTAHMHYCWINPVKHGLVTCAADWPYSSIHRDIRLGQVEPEWSGQLVEGRFGE